MFLLVEDDFMDIAAKRRGYPTINETYRVWHAKNLYKKDSTHFGNTIAVNVCLLYTSIHSMGFRGLSMVGIFHFNCFHLLYE